MFVHVAVPVPGLDLLTYSVPADLDVPAVGARVVVPLGSRIVTGVVIEHAERPPFGAVEVKPIRQVLDALPFVPPDVVALARWTAEYYACGVGDTIPALLPPMARGGRADAHKTIRVAAITASGLEAVARGVQPSVTDAERSPERLALPVRQREAPPVREPQTLPNRQREALELLAGS